ncbi:hypothetical protein ACGFYU_06015 [Streptomyces sp. NPDC048337]
MSHVAVGVVVLVLPVPDRTQIREAAVAAALVLGPARLTGPAAA